MLHARFVFIPFILAAFLVVPAFGQSYNTAAGIRVDNGLNLTVQQYIKDGWTAEGILHTGFNSQDLGVTLLAEKHHKVLFRALNFYAGAGAHYYNRSAATRLEDKMAKNVFGASFIGGAEISLGRINLAVDWKPEVHLAGDQIHPFDWNGASISARYIIDKRERKKVKDWKVWDKMNVKKSKKRR
ncbi:MAG TPA: hypothetical protein PK971_03480 [Saprospiraceae bacterium]|nr:hypothetical protein [Saprospiraceae bacterium]HND87361.1 hypothetical protein [Saprospiraceae bacterium]HNG88768.1 hypothetical protein [Saprospiraceae bacterium]